MPNADYFIPLVEVTNSSNKDQKQATDGTRSPAKKSNDGNIKAQLKAAKDKAKSDVKAQPKAAKDKAKLKAAKENQATEGADSPAKKYNNGDGPGTLAVPMAADVKAQLKADKDKAKLKAAKAKQKKDNPNKKKENSRLHDLPVIIKGRTSLPLQILQLDPHDRNPTKLFSLLQVAKPLLDARGRSRHIRHNSNFRMLPSLHHPFKVWIKSVVKPWDGE